MRRRTVGQADGRTAGRGAPRVLAVLALALGWSASLGAQGSQFTVRGLGTPGRSESVRARTTGGALAPFDATSGLVDAALADLPRLTTGALAATSYRTLELDGGSASLRSSRFPLVGVAGPIRRGLVIGGGFSSYLERSFRVERIDTLLLPLRDTSEVIRDRIESDGGVTDVRLALAARLLPGLAIGVGAHVLSGSTRETVAREFEDTAFVDSREVAEVSYDGLGGSASLLASPGGGLRAAAWLRSETRLRTKVQGRETARRDLPLEAGGALSWQVTPEARLAAAASWRSWAGATTGADTLTNSFDTFTWSVGAEIGRATRPFRLGVRRAQLPFGPGAEAPTELAVAAGSGFSFSQGRGIVDFGLERLERKGPGLKETVWTALVGVTVRP